APIGSSKFLGSKEESMACVLRRYGVTDSGISQKHKTTPGSNRFKAEFAEERGYEWALAQGHKLVPGLNGRLWAVWLLMGYLKMRFFETLH
ncbi:MAG: hypothetical protein P8X74_12570, partial [Reinekea sp.]